MIRILPFLLLIAAQLGCTPPNSSNTMVAVAPAEPTATVEPEMRPRAILPDGFVVGLELAVAPDERANGLMFRPAMAEDHGMLFLFEASARLSIWMKNTFIPLDIVFLDGQGVVVDISENAQPCKADPCPHYIPIQAASAVLELAAGTAPAHGLSRGARIQFENVAGYPADVR